MGVGVHDEKGGNNSMSMIRCMEVMCPNKNEYGYCKSTACTNPKHNVQTYASNGTAPHDYSEFATNLKLARADIEALIHENVTLKDQSERLTAIIKSLGCITCIGCEIEDDDNGNCKRHIISELNAAESLKFHINTLKARAEKAEANISKEINDMEKYKHLYNETLIRAEKAEAECDAVRREICTSYTDSNSCGAEVCYYRTDNGKCGRWETEGK